MAIPYCFGSPWWTATQSPGEDDDNDDDDDNDGGGDNDVDRNVDTDENYNAANIINPDSLDHGGPIVGVATDQDQIVVDTDAYGKETEDINTASSAWPT